MALLQISEPGQIASDDHSGTNRNVVGIDLGTTHSLVAAVEKDGSVLLMTDQQGHALLPSIVHYGNTDILVGDTARSQLISNPLNTFSSIKRLMGKGVEDVSSLQSLSTDFLLSNKSEKNLPLITTAQGCKSAVEISAEILKVLRIRAEKNLDGPLDGAVITVPAYFDDAQRQATKDAAKLAGIDVLRLLNEPTAAAFAYGFDASEEGTVAVYDLGGGTFDFSILQMAGGVFRVMATGGDTQLGGDDFDECIAQWILKQSHITADSLDPAQKQNLVAIARHAKITLSDQTEVKIDWNDWSGVLTRVDFEQTTKSLIERTVRLMRRAFIDAGIKGEDLHAVIMVGGSTRIPAVCRYVSELTGQTPMTDINPDEVVACGAARQAELLSGNTKSGALLLDVTPLSLGIETMGGLMEKVIPRNTTIPVARAQEFTTYQDGQTAMVIHVLQGERELISDNRSLASFTLRGIPPMPAGIARIRVTFQVDTDGLLSVSACETRTEMATKVEVKPSYGLHDEDITRMLQTSFDHASEDVKRRRLRECQLKADQLLMALDNALKADSHLLEKNDLHQLNDAADKLREVQKSDEIRLIERETENLNQASETFALKRVNASVRQRLSGHSIDEFVEQQAHEKKT